MIKTVQAYAPCFKQSEQIIFKLTRIGQAMSGRNRRFSSFTPLALLALAGLVLTLVPLRVQAADTRASIEVNGHKRNLRLVETARLKKTPRTTIIVFHAGRGSVTRLQRSLGLDELARKSGAVLVYPGAINGRWDVGKASGPATDDAQFVKAIITKLVADGVSDRRKIYVAGVSSGGMLAMRLACESTDLFAGAAALIANLPADLAANCNPTKPLPFLLINGTADPLVPFNGGKSTLPDYADNVVSTQASLEPFIKAAKCSEQITRQDLPDRDPNDGSRVILEKYAACSAPIELLRIEGGGHTIPGRRTPSSRGAAVGAQNNDIDSARAIFDFFKRAGSAR